MFNMFVFLSFIMIYLFIHIKIHVYGSLQGFQLLFTYLLIMKYKEMRRILNNFCVKVQEQFSGVVRTIDEVRKLLIFILDGCILMDAIVIYVFLYERRFLTTLLDTYRLCTYHTFQDSGIA